MATTTNYGWTTPDDTSLVKDGAAAIRTLGTSVDTTTKNLNPSTTLGDIEYRSSTANVNTRLALGTAGQVLTVNAGATAPEWKTSGATIQTAVFNDTKASGVGGGTFTTGAWRTRDLNTTQQNNITGCSLASNQITLPAGTYLIEGQAPAFKPDNHQTRIYNITGSASLFLGSSAYSDPSVFLQTTSQFTGVITLASSTVIELQHRNGNTNSVGFGQPNAWGDNIYASISITKVA
jgi:hypothetical protein